MKDNLHIGKLHFRPLDVEGKTSISGDLAKDEAFGIYAYEFTDATWYVGKSENVVKRHIQHLHEYKHEVPPLIIKRMFWAPIKGNQQQLDYAETQAISGFERKGYRLRNVMKTGRPKSDLEVIVDTGKGWGVSIPWDRKNLPKSKHDYIFEESEGKKARWQKLKQLCDYEKLRSSLMQYVKNTIPAPADTAGLLWVATVLPSTGKGYRLCCISCQNAETLVVFQEEKGAEIFGFINVKRNEEGKLPRWPKKQRASYGTLPHCCRLFFDSQEDLDALLKDDLVLDCSYRANAELMRRGVTMYGRFNNPYFVKDILDAS